MAGGPAAAGPDAGLDDGLGGGCDGGPDAGSGVGSDAGSDPASDPAAAALAAAALAAADPLLRLRAYVGGLNLTLNDRLPPERRLAQELGLSRAALRKAMAVLEAEGQVWRQVGRGTFIGARPVLNLAEVRYLGSISSPLQIHDARLIIEPGLARLAALHAVASDLAELRLCARRCSEAKTWQVFEAWDNRLHYAVAATTRNKLLMTVFETLNAVRRTLAWQTARSARRPDSDYTTFIEHDAIVAAIARREPQQAAAAMRSHLESVRTRLVLRGEGPRRPGAGGSEPDGPELGGPELGGPETGRPEQDEAVPRLRPN